MGAAPSVPSADQLDALLAATPSNVTRAASAVSTAEVLIFLTGAGWSADSGLAVYADVAKSYSKQNLTYYDLCNPAVMRDLPLFHGFWGTCFNDYRDTTPHEGYNLARRWRDAKIGSGGGNNFFSFTSNVDAHWHRSGIPASELRECHGNSEHFQCSERHCVSRQSKAGSGSCVEGGRWRAPPAFRFDINKETLKATPGPPAAGAGEVVAGTKPFNALPALNVWSCAKCSYDNNVELTKCQACMEPYPESADKENAAPSAYSDAVWNTAFQANHPTCLLCGAAARPAILMFNDVAWADDDKQSAQWRSWRSELIKRAKENRGLKVTLVEVGAGGNVTTVRNESESLISDLGAAGAVATLIRINPELMLADDKDVAERIISLPLRGLEAMKKIDGEVTF